MEQFYEYKVGGNNDVFCFVDNIHYRVWHFGFHPFNESHRREEGDGKGIKDFLRKRNLQQNKEKTGGGKSD